MKKINRVNRTHRFSRRQCLDVFFFKQKTAYGFMPSRVGSEMYIRDSQPKTPPKLHAVRKHAYERRRQLNATHESGRHTQLTFCARLSPARPPGKRSRHGSRPNI